MKAKRKPPRKLSPLVKLIRQVELNRLATEGLMIEMNMFRKGLPDHIKLCEDLAVALSHTRRLVADKHVLIKHARDLSAQLDEVCGQRVPSPVSLGSEITNFQLVD